jgi:hypothetical protein
MLFSCVMPAVGAGIHAFLFAASKGVDGRTKSAHDGF